MAHIIRPGVAETTTTEGTGDLTLAGRAYGALAAFFDAAVMGSAGDTCDYVIQYGDIREEGLGTRTAGDLLERTTVYWARHANGDIDQDQVTLPPGQKTVFMTVASDRVARFVDAIRAQTLTQTERDQACENLGLPQSGDKVITPQETAWIGWTKDMSLHDAAIRIVTDTNGGGLGGSVVFSTLFGRTSVDSTSPSTSTMAAHSHGGATANGGVDHTHSYTSPSGSGTFGAGGFAFTPNAAGANTGGASAYVHAHGINSEGSGQAHTHSIDMRVKYRNAIICTKD